MTGEPEQSRHRGRLRLRAALIGSAALMGLGLGSGPVQGGPASATACTPSAECAIERAAAQPAPARTFARGQQQAALAVALAERDPARAASFLRAAQATLRAAARAQRGRQDEVYADTGFTDVTCLARPDACLAQMAAHPALATTLGTMLRDSNADFYTWLDAVLAMGRVDAEGTRALLAAVPSASDRSALTRQLLERVTAEPAEQFLTYRLSGDHWRAMLALLLRELPADPEGPDVDLPDPARGAAMALLGDFEGGLQVMAGLDDTSALDNAAVRLFVSDGFFKCYLSECRPFLVSARMWAEQQGNRDEVLAYIGTTFAWVLGQDQQLDLIERFGKAADQAFAGDELVARLTLAGRLQELEELAARYPFVRARIGQANPALEFAACFGQGRTVEDCVAVFGEQRLSAKGSALSAAQLVAGTNPTAMGWSTTQWSNALHGLISWAHTDETWPTHEMAIALSHLTLVAVRAGHGAAGTDLVVRAPASWNFEWGVQHAAFGTAFLGDVAAAGMLRHVAQSQLSALSERAEAVEVGPGVSLSGDCWGVSGRLSALNELAVLRCIAIAQAQVGAVTDAIASLEALEGLGFGQDGIGLSCIARVQAARGDWAGAFATMERFDPSRRPGRIARRLISQGAVARGLIGPPDWSQVAVARPGEIGACTWATGGELMRAPMTVE